MKSRGGGHRKIWELVPPTLNKGVSEGKGGEKKQRKKIIIIKYNKIKLLK